MRDKDFSKISKNFLDLLCETFWNYYLWERIREFINSKSETANFIDERYKEFFVPVLFALQDKYMLLLANLLDSEKENKDKKVISIYELLLFVGENDRKIIDLKLEKLNEEKKKLSKWRNKYIAHKDYTLWIKGYNDFTKKYHLNFTDLYNMMLILWEVYDDIIYIVDKNPWNDFSDIKDSYEVWFNKLINDIKYFIPVNEDEIIKIISDKIIKEEFNHT